MPHRIDASTEVRDCKLAAAQTKIRTHSASGAPSSAKAAHKSPYDSPPPFVSASFPPWHLAASNSPQSFAPTVPLHAELFLTVQLHVGDRALGADVQLLLTPGGQGGLLHEAAVDTLSIN